MILAYDAFRRNIGSLTGGDPWVTPAGGSNFNFTSDQHATPSSFGGSCSSVFDLFTWPNDHYAKCKIIALGTASGAQPKGGGVGVRLNTANENGYYLYTNIGGATFNTFLVKQTAGPVVTVLDSSVNPWALGDEIYLGIQGTTLTAKRNGVQIATVIDSDISSGSAGIAYNNTITEYILDNWEGGDFSAEPTPSLSTLVTDNFDRANSIGLGVNWSDITGIVQPNIVNNEATSVIDPFAARYSAIIWPRNQFSQIRCTGVQPITQTPPDGAGVAVRMNDTGANTCYYFQIGGAAAQSAGDVRKIVAGVTTNLYINILPVITGDVIYIQSVQDVISAYINGTCIFATKDTSISSGQAGIRGAANPEVVTFDAWRGGGERIFSFPQSTNILRRNRVISY